MPYDHDLLHREGLDAWYVLRDCGTARDAAALPQLLAVIALPEQYFPEREATRRIAAWALGRLGFDALQSCEGAARSPNPLLREGYADALGETRDARAVPTLEWLALDTDRGVALWASLSLAKCGDASVPAIRQCLARDPSFSHAANLVDALRMIASDDALTLLDNYVASSPWADELRSLLARRDEANQGPSERHA